jgi:hypothetical protein
MLLAKPQEAGFYNINFDPDGKPNEGDLVRAAEEAVLIRISLN